MAAKPFRQTRCFVCGQAGVDFDGFVLLQGRATRLHCSLSCLASSVDRQRQVATVRRRRRWLALAILVLVAAGVNTVRRYRAPAPEWISGDSPEPLPSTPEPGPQPYGPAWPPTDDEWATWFAMLPWSFPLPGPVRHSVSPDGAVYGPASTEKQHHRLVCRTAGHCGVNLGGALWGEHVYAALDGVVDRVVGAGRDERGGQYVRIAHLGGLVFTQYFHLAGMPRTLFRGSHVKAGDLIGLLGDTGTDDGRKRLYFALSARPSPTLPEVYWDPSPWMGSWPLRLPPNGTVAGLVLPARDTARRHRPD